jgi:ribonuclease R
VSSRKKKTIEDPKADRESARYAHPIASRELILERLREAQRPLNIDATAALLRIDGERDLEALRRRLRAMCRDGQLIVDRRGRYALVEKLDLFKGRIQAHRDGFAWLIREDGGDDVHIHERQLHSAMDGDLVLARISGHRRDGKPEGVVTEVIERAHHHITGRFGRAGGVGILEPANRRIPHEILIAPEDAGGAEPGDWVDVELTRFPEAHAPAWGRVERVLGDASEHATRVEVILGAHGVPRVWPDELDGELAALPSEVHAEDARGRVDLRGLDLVTIDGEDARDFDDAVYCEPRKGGGWRVLVAIADVSHYVRPGTALDVSALERGNSVYLPSTVVPMLPEALSNDLCSLRPRVDRLCMVCEMTVSARGRVSGYRFFEGIMNSSARLTYDRVARLLEQGVDAVREDDPEIAALAPRLEVLHELFRALVEARHRRGAVDFSGSEAQVVLDDAGKVVAVRPLVRNDAHRLIEECMIAANVAAARFLAQHELPGLYRVHDSPSASRAEDLRAFLAGLGVAVPGGDIPTPADLQQLIESVAHRPDRSVIETVVLRTMKQAQYTARNDGHFGLALTAYTHFTSPIRRYADLLVHRAIRHVIRSRRESSHVLRQKGAGILAKAAIYPYEQAGLENIGEHISATERRADTASRDMVDWLKCEFMESRIGDEFEGTVTGVTSFGLFVELDGVHVSGLIHVTGLPEDYYHFDDTHLTLTGDGTRLAFGLGDRLRVQLARVDVDDRKIDFELLEVLSTHRPPRRTGKQRDDRRGGGRGGARGNARDKRGGRATGSARGKARGPRKRRS